MMYPDNIIKKLSFDIEIEANTSAISLGEEVVSYCQEELLGILEDQLEPYKNEERLAIDILEIDLGSIPYKEYSFLIKERLRELILLKLQGLKLKKREKPTAEFLFQGNTISDAFHYFLEKGCLPWWYPVEGMGPIVEAFERGENRNSKSKALLSYLVQHARARNRFIRTFSHEKKIALIKSSGISQRLIDEYFPLFEILQETLLSSINEQQFQRVFWEVLIVTNKQLPHYSPEAKRLFLLALLSHASILGLVKKFHLKQGEEKESEAPFLMKLKKLWPEVDITQSILKELKIAPNGKMDRGNIEANIHSSPEDTREKVKDERPSISEEKMADPSVIFPKRIEPDPKENQEQATNSLIEEETNKIKRNPEQNYREDELQEEAKTGLYVYHAGIVLLHPFLATFFEELNLLDKGKFKNETSARKGVQLLAYLSTGSNHCPEYEMLLFKHICSLPWSTCISPDLGISLSERKEADALLEAVLKHWGALKNTSPDGLRTGFIKRNGKLANTDKGWHLHMEQKSQDILLQHLPWNLGVLKFPWMKEMIWINWI